MAKLSGPLLSFGASGAVGKTIVASKWKGVPYMRQYVVPANPQTAAQQLTRKTFALMREMYKLAPSPVRETWDAFAKGRPFTGMNKFVGENIRVLRGQADMLGFIGSPGAAGGLVPASFTAEPGAAPGEIDVTFVMPEPPPGWTLDSVVASAFLDQDPGDFFVGPYQAIEVAAPDLTGTLTGLPTGEQCIVAGWAKWTKPNGSKAYSVGLSLQVNAT